jgi:hypothetical protein
MMIKLTMNKVSMAELMTIKLIMAKPTKKYK